MEPLFFEPILKQARWGGRKLGEILGKPIGTAADYAESWEIADQKSGDSVVARGSRKGRRLSELVRHEGAALLGRHRHVTQFPLLIKFLDANDWLSLQVHPDDLQARSCDSAENGKTEAWVILQADPDSRICSGLKAGVTREQLSSALLNERSLEDCLHIIPVKTGDCIFVPAQTVHALGPGIVMAEVQQQSNLTFRLSDWGRLGTDGKPRELHVEQSLNCTDFGRGPVDPVVPRSCREGDHLCEELVACEHFVIRRHSTGDAFSLRSIDSFRILMLLTGEVVLSWSGGESPFVRGQTTLLPAALGDATVRPGGEIELLDITLPTSHAG
ncbi:MAG: type I phosphomannose isomerase catalytic subunit [Planctomycetaceae bacterium]